LSLPLWPRERLGEALEAIVAASRLVPSRDLRPLDNAPPVPRAPLEVAVWIVAAGEHLGVEALPAETTCGEVSDMLARCAPALVEVVGQDGFAAIVGARGKTLRMLGPDLGVRTVPRRELEAAIVAPLARSVDVEVEQCLDAAQLEGAERERAKEALVRERLFEEPLRLCHLLREVPASARQELRRESIGKNLAVSAMAHGAQSILALVAWYVIGDAVFSDHFDRGWLWAALGLLASAIPFLLLEEWHSGLMMLEVGARLKQRLLVGALRLDPEEIRYDGVGSHLARVIESEALQEVVLGGTAYAVMATCELLLGAWVLASGAGGALHAALLGVFSVLFGVLFVRYLGKRRAWAAARMAMTNATVERMMGYATRLVQEPSHRWHELEDRELEDYLVRSRDGDAAQRLLVTAGTRGWLVIGLLGLAVPFVRGTATSASLAVGLGGVLFVNRALGQLTNSMSALVDVFVSWRAVGSLYHAATRREPPGALALALGAEMKRGDAPLIEARDVTFRYPKRESPVLTDVTARIERGDRVLIEGSSGSGKSTFGALVAGIRRPTSGLVLFRGLDATTLGVDGWRRRIVAAPQFHENHVFTGTMAFNLLMGRRWPATHADMEDADEVCRALDLGPLLDRLPSGLMTIVGETGWQLSHGEKSRVYIARALLQNADAVVLDESFAALDPETLDHCMRTVLARANTVVVIAHP
jgi:ATP-binding cassette subfamily B protein